MMFAIVNVLPEPVTPISTCSWRPSRRLRVSSAMAAGWSPAGWNGDSSRNCTANSAGRGVRFGNAEEGSGLAGDHGLVVGHGQQVGADSFERPRAHAANALQVVDAAELAAALAFGDPPLGQHLPDAGKLD